MNRTPGPGRETSRPRADQREGAGPYTGESRETGRAPETVRQVVIVGGGQAGFQTAVSLREAGYEGGIALIAGESTPPYQRPPLSKAYLAGDADLDDVLLRPEAFYGARSLGLVTGDPATGIDREARTVTLASGRSLPYDRLVLATGARPRPLPVPGADLVNVLNLRSLADADALRDRLAERPRLVVVGAGFIGLELAAVARASGLDVTVVETRPRALSRSVSGPVADRLVAEHRDRGVRLLFGTGVHALHGDAAGRVREAELDSGVRLPAGLVVAGIGVEPDTDLAASAGLGVTGGVVVDAYLRTSDPAILAVGDCARHPSPYADGRHVRPESVQNATDQARCAAAGIASGAPEPYTAVPWFWSDQYALKLQIAGLTAGHDRTEVTGDPEGGRFSVFCFRDGRLAGVESVNKPADHVFARRLLASPGEGLAPAAVAAPGFDLRTHLASGSGQRAA